MADDKDNRGARDRVTVSGDETYELDYFATKHDLSREEAQALIDRVGNSREALESAIDDRANAARVTKRSPAKNSDKPARAAAAPRRVPASNSKNAPAKKSPRTPARPASGASKPVRTNATVVARQRKADDKGRTASARKALATPSKTTAKRTSAVTDGAKSTATGRLASIVGAAAVGLAAGIAANFGRKAIVQAPSALAGDWFEALKKEHELALALFDKLQEIGSDNAGKRTALLTQLKHALGKHAFTEENVIYPALRANGDKEHADELNHDHGYVKQNLYDLEGMDNASPEFLAKVASFRADLEEHIREEENLIFPPLHAALGEDGNAKLTAQVNKEGFKLA